MRVISGRPLAALPALALAALAWTAPVTAAAQAQTVTVVNTAPRLADCAVVIDGRLRTYVKIRTGNSWSGSFDPRRIVELVCEHAVNVNGVFRIQPGSNYRLVDVKGRLDIAAAE